MILHSFRSAALTGLAFCVLMMAVALGLEHIGGYEPCPLCIFQRVAVIAAGIVFAIAAIHSPAGRVGKVIYGLLSLTAVGTGAFIAGRHVWLQGLPADEVPSCGPGLDYMMDILPMQDVVAMVLTGSGECANIDFSLLGLSLPAWTLIGFAILAIAPLRMLLMKSRG
ncbi:disulfide bond formation protein B [Halomonas titanicae]|uniref:disulfide bond formation protein B n=1 Tax=Vreelandella titanicae TaxID=664683 RepID=UPI001F4240C7|nr:disulfide bond formation protein B [Halomonas titanicae]MCE7520834.1 disulfide bond formation protein B [Halomonas titanicae]